MSDITLNSAVRSNLRSLQSTTTLMNSTEERLSSGKKVNSALDNPSNYFTAQSLDRRSSDLSGLLDSVANSVQTLKAADNGITAISDLVSQMKSTARTAQQSTSAVADKAAITAGATITGATEDSLLGAGTLTGSVTSLKSSAAEIGSSGTISVAYGATPTTKSYTYSASDSVDDVISKINADTTTTKIAASIDTSTGKLKFTNTDTVSDASVADSGAVTGDASIAVLKSANATSTNVVQTQIAAADPFEINGASVTTGNSIDSMITNINAQTSTTGVKASLVNGAFSLTNTSGGSVSVKDLTSTTTTILDGASGTVFADNALEGKTLKVKVGDGDEKTVTFGTGADEVDTLDELNDSLKSAGAQASIDKNGKMTITTINANEADNLTITGGSATSNSGASASSGVLFKTTSGAVSASATFDETDKKSRNDYKNDYNDLLDQITTLAQDASYNGINLLSGDDLKVSFNEDGTSSLDIAGTDVLDTLGLSTLSGDEFLDSSSLDDVVDTLNTALSNLDGLSSKFGSQLSVVQTRQDFTKNMISTLDDGSNNLTAADTNEEAANLATLQTRQSLIVSSLSISTSQEQNILQLLR